MSIRTAILLIGGILAIVSSVITRNFSDLKTGIGILLLFGLAFIINGYINKEK